MIGPPKESIEYLEGQAVALSCTPVFKKCTQSRTFRQ